MRTWGLTGTATSGRDWNMGHSRNRRTWAGEGTEGNYETGGGDGTGDGDETEGGKETGGGEKVG